MISSAAWPNVALRKPPSVGPDRLASSSVASPISPAAGMSAMAAATNSHSDVFPVSARNQLNGTTTRSKFSQLPVSDFDSCPAIDTPRLLSKLVRDWPGSRDAPQRQLGTLLPWTMSQGSTRLLVCDCNVAPDAAVAAGGTAKGRMDGITHKSSGIDCVFYEGTPALELVSVENVD